ncbi:hypothetical protein AB0K43_08310 [Kitasatospora sp. NPDC049258]|uniref:hypothetical protein n=1 Tax=Kitasatospora sp. NPDC049258 TaxID=3155394 RepID=UPI00341416D7
MTEHQQQALARLLADPAAGPAPAAAWNVLRSTLFDLGSGPSGLLGEERLADLAAALALVGAVDAGAREARAALATGGATGEAVGEATGGGTGGGTGEAVDPVPAPPPSPAERYERIAREAVPDPAAAELLAGAYPQLLAAVSGLLALAAAGERLGRIDIGRGGGDGALSRFESAADLAAYRSDLLLALDQVVGASSTADRLVALNLLDRHLRELVPVAEDGPGRLLVLAPPADGRWAELLAGSLATQTALAGTPGCLLKVGVPEPGGDFRRVRDAQLLAEENCLAQPPRPAGAEEYRVVWAYQGWLVDETSGRPVPLCRARVVFTERPLR